MTKSTDTDTAPYAAARAAFEKNTTDHQMTVLHDDGLYRHLRFRAPDTAIWGFDIVTWPGHLSIAGDIGDGYMFARIEDMTDFFRHIVEPWRINPSYWAEKMPRTIKHKVHSEERVKWHIREATDEWAAEMTKAERKRLAAAVSDLISDNDLSDPVTAYEAVDDFNFDDRKFYDTWEWDFTDWDFHFLIALFAIVWGCEQYRASKTPATEAAS